MFLLTLSFRFPDKDVFDVSLSGGGRWEMTACVRGESLHLSLGCELLGIDWEKALITESDSLNPV